MARWVVGVLDVRLVFGRARRNGLLGGARMTENDSSWRRGTRPAVLRMEVDSPYLTPWVARVPWRHGLLVIGLAGIVGTVLVIGLAGLGGTGLSGLVIGIAGLSGSQLLKIHRCFLTPS